MGNLWSAALPVAIAAATSPGPAFELGLPLACEPGLDCWVVRYVDRDPGPGFADFRCGTLGSDGHDGTDFAIPDPRRMAAGVAVVAAAAGTVRGVRDGMPDQPPGGRLAHDFGAMSCGNGVLVEHDDGWETQYCHLRQGSVGVASGQQVASGQALGLVGMSGEANFPHVHLSVRRAGVTVDPFTGSTMPAACGEPGAALWTVPLAYDEVPIAMVGLTDHVPGHGEIVAGTAEARLRQDSAALVAYVLAYGLRAGDRIELAVRGPDGSAISAAGFAVEQAPARVSRSAGRRAPPGGWASGPYRVEALVRRGERRFARTATFTVAQ